MRAGVWITSTATQGLGQATEALVGVFSLVIGGSGDTETTGWHSSLVMKEGSEANLLSQGVELCLVNWGQTEVLATDSPGTTDRISGRGGWASGTAAEGRLQKIEPLTLGSFHKTLGQGTLVIPQQGWVVATRVN